MTTTKLMMLIAVLTASGASAQTVDPLRCEARQMRAEGARFDCLSRCDKRADRAADRPAGRRTAEEIAGTCAGRCDSRYDETLVRLGVKPPCAPELADPSPQECEARLLRVSAAAHQCQARCSSRATRRGFDAAGCLAACATRCGTAEDEMNANPVCTQGRIGSRAICSTN